LDEEYTHISYSRRMRS